MKPNVKDDFDDDDNDADEIDEHELETRSTGGQTINWRRVELVREKLWLKQQLADFDDYPD